MKKQNTSALCVKRVHVPERLYLGDTNCRPVQQIDSAAWIWRADTTGNNVFLRFQKSFVSDGSVCRIHVSADERYILYIDGERVSRGPDRGDVLHWTYKSYDLELPKGKHTIAAVVWRVGDYAPLAQLSWEKSGGFILKAEGTYDKQLTTGLAQWDVARLPDLGWCRGHGFGVGAHIVARGNSPIFTQPAKSEYSKAVVVRCAIGQNLCGLVHHGWNLYPSTLPDQLNTRLRPGKFVAAADVFDEREERVYSEADGKHPALSMWNGLLADAARPVVIPPNTQITLLWNLDNYFCAYYEMDVAGGEGACIKWSWSESLYHGDNLCDKRDRDAFVGKKFSAPGDEFYPDGSANCSFTHPWWSSGKWCRIMVKTADKPLKIKRLELFETHYPFDISSSFVSDDASIGKIQKLAIRGMEMCSHEMGFDCPYYEQQMYPGDTRIQLLVQGILSNDDRLIRRDIELYDFSRQSDGSVGFNYPTRGTQSGWTYTLIWPLMLGDYALWHDNIAWLKARIPGLRHTMSGAKFFENEEGLLDKLAGWSFIDWVPAWRGGVAPDGYECNCINNLFYVHALKSAALVESIAGEPEVAAMYNRKAKEVGKKIVAKFWNEKRGCLADTTAPDSPASEHCQCLAIILDLLPAAKAKRAAKALVNDSDLARCTVYFSHYLFEAYAKIGRTDLVLKRLDLWRDYVKANMRTPLEMPDPSRSDCHAWGAHPLYHLHANIAGVRPAAPLFSSVLVAPQPGGLKKIRTSTPHPKGIIKTNLIFDGDSASGTVTLPKGVSGSFMWKNKVLPLTSGVNKIG